MERGFLVACQAKVDLALDIAPFLGCAQPPHKFLEIGRVLGRELEPGQEIEGLAEVAPMMQAPGDRGKVLKTRSDMAGAFLEDAPPLVLGQLPPRLGLLDRDQRGARGPWPAKRLLAGGQLVVLAARDVSLVARDTAQHPGRVTRPRGGGSLDHRQPGRGLQWLAGDSLDALDPPWT